MPAKINDGLTNRARWILRHPEQAAAIRTAKRARQRRAHPEWERRYVKTHPAGTSARRAIRQAIRDGLTPRAAEKLCQQCGTAAQEYHHPDYRKPLQVIALCRPCHNLITQGLTG